MHYAGAGHFHLNSTFRGDTYPSTCSFSKQPDSLHVLHIINILQHVHRNYYRKQHAVTHFITKIAQNNTVNESN